MTMYRQVYTLIAIRVLRAFMIIMPIIGLYFQSHGLSIRDIFLLQVVFSVAVVVLEIPTGYLADVFGHKRSIIAGTIFATLGFLQYYVADGFIGFLGAEMLLAFSISFISGANQALLFDTLKAHAKESLYKKYQGYLLGFGNISEAAAAILAGFVAALYTLETVFLIQWIVLAFSVPLAFTLREIVDRKAVETPTLMKIISGSFRENERLRYLNLFAGAVAASTLTMVWFSQPHWESIGVPLAYFGIMWAFLNLCVAFGAFLAHRLEHWFRFRELFLGMALAPVVLYVLMAFGSTSLAILVVVPGFWLLRGLQVPIIQDYVQREAHDNDRATVLSINALSTRVIFSIFSPFLGWVADAWSFQMAFAASAVVFGTLTLIGFAFLYAAMQRKPA